MEPALRCVSARSPVLARVAAPNPGRRGLRRKDQSAAVVAERTRVMFPKIAKNGHALEAVVRVDQGLASAQGSVPNPQAVTNVNQQVGRKDHAHKATALKSLRRDRGRKNERQDLALKSVRRDRVPRSAGRGLTLKMSCRKQAPKSAHRDRALRNVRLDRALRKIDIAQLVGQRKRRSAPGRVITADAGGLCHVVAKKIAEVDRNPKGLAPDDGAVVIVPHREITKPPRPRNVAPDDLSLKRRVIVNAVYHVAGGHVLIKNLSGPRPRRSTWARIKTAWMSTVGC